MVARRGEVWWASLGDPLGSGPGFRRPVLIVQSNEFNESAIRTVVCAVVTSNLRLAAAPETSVSGAKPAGCRGSVVNVSPLVTVEKHLLTARVGRLSARALQSVESGVRLVLAR